MNFTLVGPMGLDRRALSLAVSPPSGRVIDEATTVWAFILVGFFGSAFYGALAFIFFGLGDSAIKIAREARWRVVVALRVALS
jgi:hypothetical protein